MLIRLFSGIALALFALHLYSKALEAIRKEGLVIRRYSGGFGGNSTRWQISSPLLFVLSAFAVLGVAVTVAFYGVVL